MDVNEQEQRVQEVPETQFDPDAKCDRCGQLGAYQFGEKKVCLECYEGCGSCCPEFGQDDLWEFAEEH